MTEQDSRRAIGAVFRIESARLIASLMRLVRDVGLATKAELRAAESTEVLAAMKTWLWGQAVRKTLSIGRAARATAELAGVLCLSAGRPVC